MGEKIGDFNAPYHAGSAAPNAPYGYAGEPDIDPHHTPTSSGGKLLSVLPVLTLLNV